MLCSRPARFALQEGGGGLEFPVRPGKMRESTLDFRRERWRGFTCCTSPTDCADGCFSWLRWLPPERWKAGRPRRILSTRSKPAARSSPANARGKRLPGLACPHDPAQSYALYLPSQYAPERRWPILYLFDPSAEG